MRRLGQLADEAQAARLIDYLLTQRIEATCEADTHAGQPVYDIWIRDEDRLLEALRHFQTFQANPNDARYDVQREAKSIRAQAEQDFRRRVKLRRRAPVGGPSGLMSRQTPLTIGFIVTAVVIGFITNFSRPRTPLGVDVYRSMMLVDPFQYIERIRANEPVPSPLEWIQRGQVWRLLSPALLHGNIMHLAFNMLAMYSLGGVIERLHGSRFLLRLILWTGVIAMLTQAIAPEQLGGTPLALGASGVIFGLFGYLWIRPMVDPGYPVRIPPGNVAFILGFMILCMTPMIGNIANAAHVGGLFAGMVVIPFQRWQDTSDS